MGRFFMRTLLFCVACLFVAAASDAEVEPLMAAGLDEDVSKAEAERKQDLARIAAEDAQVEAEKEAMLREHAGAELSDRMALIQTEEEDLSMPHGWKRLVNPAGKEYFWNTKTGYTSWTKPDVTTGQHKAVVAEDDFEHQDMATLKTRNEALMRQIKAAERQSE